MAAPVGRGRAPRPLGPAGRLGYEKVKPWPVREIGDSENPGRTVKMSYPRKVKDPESGKKVPDRTVLKVAENLTIEGIPVRAYDYVVNGKSAIDWLIKQYQCF